MASFAPPRFQLARRASADFSDKIYHAVVLNSSGELVLGTFSANSLIYGFLINNPRLGELGEVASFGGGAKGVLDIAAVAGTPLGFTSAPGTLTPASSGQLAVARALESGDAGDVIEIEPVLFTVP